MQSQYSLTQLAQELESRAAKKKDMVVDTRHLSMTDTGELSVHQGGEYGTVENYSISDLAHGQIATRLGIPGAYYNKMLASSGDLLANNVNHWMQRNPEKRLVRTLDGHARAFLSDNTSRWGMLNAVTRTAQDVENYDRATELETIGGNILAFPQKDWEQVAMAAAA
jgi:hypothetical protein